MCGVGSQAQREHYRNLGSLEIHQSVAIFLFGQVQFFYKICDVSREMLYWLEIIWTLKVSRRKKKSNLRLRQLKDEMKDKVKSPKLNVVIFI